MGFTIRKLRRASKQFWGTRIDRSKSYNGERLGTMSNMLDELPTQFNDATNRTIELMDMELIDVLWLKDNTILAAFEIEATTSVYSALLRMSDLLARLSQKQSHSLRERAVNIGPDAILALDETIP